MERILLQVYESLHGCLFDEQGVTTLDHLAKNPCKDNLLACLASESCNKSLDRYDEFKETVRQGALGKTAQFWLSYMEKVGLILQFHRATKENCLVLHLASVQRNVQHVFQLRSPKLCKILCNPFTTEDKDTLYCPSSGTSVPSDVESDILMSDEIGKKAHKQFVQDRLIDKTVSFHAPVKKQNLKTFANQAKTSLVQGKARKNIEITAERNVFGQRVILYWNHC